MEFETVEVDYDFKKALIVDDNWIDNFVNQRVMKEYNLAKDCVVIDSSTEAYTYIENELKPENEYPDLILLDINMPGHNGFELLERIESKIKEHNLKIKVYMLSSSNLDKDIDKAKQYSCVVDYIVKPLTVEKFMAFM